MKFGDKLVALRKKNGLSQEELAEKLGVSRQSVSKWESNNAYPETDKIVQICNLFDCSMDDLINDSITDLKQIERKEKNAVAGAVDSFLEFITKTINMFSSMKFGSGLKCVTEMVILSFILMLVGLFIVGVTSSLIGNLFSFLKYQYVIESVFHNILWIVWFIVSVIVVIHTFKIRYLDYFDKIKEDNKDNKVSVEKNEKIKIEKKENIIIRDDNDKSYAFLSVLSKIIKIIVKIMLVFILMGIIPVVVSLGIVLFLSIIHINVSNFFIGTSISLLASLVISIIFLVMFINFIFNKKSKYKPLLISFLTSLVLFGVGIGICTISFKNFKIEDAKSLINDTKVIDVDYSDNLVIATSGLGDLNYEYDESLGNKIIVEVQYNNKFSNITTNNEDYYGANVLIIERESSNLTMKEFYNTVINDIKNNVLREYDNSFIITVKSSKTIIDKLLDNSSKVYTFDKKENEKGFLLENIFHKINQYNTCQSDIEYNSFTNELKTPDNCKCEKIENEDGIEINCE